VGRGTRVAGKDYVEVAKQVVRFGRDPEAPDRDLYKIGVPLDGWKFSAWLPTRDWTDSEIELLLDCISCNILDAVDGTLRMIAINDEKVAEGLKRETARAKAEWEAKNATGPDRVSGEKYCGVGAGDAEGSASSGQAEGPREKETEAAV
jgi:hypothetical protein